MRFTTLISLAVALVTASLAVVGVAVYLTKQEQAQEQRLATEQRPTVHHRIIISRRALVFGEPIVADDVEFLDWHGHELPEGYFTQLDELFVPSSTGQMLPRYALANLQPGEPLHRQRISDPGAQVKLSSVLVKGRKALSIRVNDVLGVAGFVLPGDHVDVLSTRKHDGETIVDVILQDVKVLAVDQVADQQTDQPSVVRTVTFDVSMRQAQVLTLGANIGTLSLALRHLNDRQQSLAKSLSSAPISVPKVTQTVPKIVLEKVPERVSKQPLDEPAKRIQEVTNPVTQKATKTVIKEPEEETITVIKGIGEVHRYQVPQPMVIDTIVVTNHAVGGSDENK